MFPMVKKEVQHDYERKFREQQTQRDNLFESLPVDEDDIRFGKLK